MRTIRIELEGPHGVAAIERRTGSHTIRIDSIVRNPAPGHGEQAWKTWALPSTPSDEQVHDVAVALQQRCDGFRGTNSDVAEYAAELWRFAD